MSGKKRKTPLKEKQHKFFKGSESKVSIVTTETRTENQPDPELIGLKILNERSYYHVKIGNCKQWQPITMAHDLASDIIIKIIKERESLGEIIAERDKNQIIAERDKNPNKFHSQVSMVTVEWDVHQYHAILKLCSII